MRAWLLIAALLVALCAGGPAAAQSQIAQSDQVALQVQVGFDDTGIAPTWTPVSVSLRPDRPLVGEIQVNSTTFEGAATFSRPLELAAGAPAEVRLVVPPGGIEIQVVSDGDVVATQRVRAPGAAQQPLLLGVLDRPGVVGPSVNLLPINRSGRWVDVGHEWLEVARGIASLDALVVTPDQWANLAPAAAAAVWREVTLGGMTLVVTGSTAGLGMPIEPALESASDQAFVVRRPVVPVTGEPATDQAAAGPTADGAAPAATLVAAGLGAIAVTDGGPEQLVDSAVWEAILSPRGVLDPIHDAQAYDTQPFAAQELLTSTGGRPDVPGIPFLAVFLVGYLLVVGPLNGLVLSRLHKPELAWVTVPAISLVFAAAPLVFAGAASGGESPVTSQTLTYWLDGAAEQRVAAAWRATGSDRVLATVEGEGWTAVPWGGQLGAPTVVVAPDSTTVAGDIRSGEIAGLVASRQVTKDAPLDVVAMVVDGQIDITVTNVGDQPVTRGRVIIGNRELEIRDDLIPGESFTTTDAGELQGFPLQMSTFPFEADQFSNGQFPNGEIPVGVATAFAVGPDGVETEFIQPLPPQDFRFGFFGNTSAGLFPDVIRAGTPGVVWATGVVEDQLAPLVIDGTRPGPTSTMVAVGARVQVAVPATQVPPAAIRGKVAGIPNNEPRQPVSSNDFQPDRVMVFDLPGVVDGTVLGGFFTRDGGATVELWDGAARTWRRVDATFGDVPAAPIANVFGRAFIRLPGPAYGGGLALAPSTAQLGPAPRFDGNVGGFDQGFAIPEVIEAFPIPSPEPSQ